MSTSSPGLSSGPAIALRDQIDGLGRAAHEHDLARERALMKRATRSRAPS